MPRALVALGANLGDREQSLATAVEMLRAHPQVESLGVSAAHATRPVGDPAGQADFLNRAASFETSLSAEALHAFLAEIEQRLGRQRTRRWEARLIDLDLLLYGQQVVSTATLTVPHPRMAFRRFVLEPAAEVAAEMIHPTILWTVRQLKEHLDTAANYVALLVPPQGGKTELARAVARRSDGQFVEDPAENAPLPRSDDPSGHALDRQIQFLDRRASLLDRQRWPQAAALAVSDFYLDQCLA